MTTIKDAEKLSGISAENIRYYEKQNLILPKRNSVNSYREYTDEDIRRLKMIRLFRSLDIPIGEIRRIFEGDIPLDEAIFLQIKRLESEKERLDGVIRLCGQIRETQLADLDADRYLQELEETEGQKKGYFRQFIDDYKEVVLSELIREFSFMPDTRCGSPADFTEQLLKYAQENDENIVIVREGMTPRFMMNGIEYKAYRTSGRYGIVVHCEIVHPEDYIPAGMPVSKYRRYRILSVIALPLLVFITANLWLFLQIEWFSLEGLIALLVIFSVYGANFAFIYYCYGKNFRG